MSNTSITCPHCNFSKETPMERIPQNDVQVTCPKCKQTFPLSIGIQSLQMSHATISTVQSLTLADSTHTTVDIEPNKLTKPRAFFIKRPLKLLLSATPVMMLLMPFILPFKFSQLPTEGAIVLSFFFFLTLALTVYLARKYWQPALILSSEGVVYSLGNLFKTQSLPWGQIQGISIDERTVYGKTQIMARLVIASDGKGTKEVVIGLSALEGGEEALALLKRMIPEKRAQDFSNALLKFRPLSTDTLKYRDVEIVREGIISATGKRGKQRAVIPWDFIESIKTEGFVIAGYGSVTVHYRDHGVTNRLLIQASMSEKYHYCVKLLIVNAKSAAIDPGVLAILEYPVSSAKADMFAILLVCTGIIIALAGLIILSFYPPTIASTWIYPLLLLPLCAAPFAWTIQLLSSRFKGGGADPSRKILGASLFNIGAVFAIAILFALSPASFVWMLADGNVLLGRLDLAETYYMKAEPALAKNEDFLFTLGQFYSRKKNWDKASRYYVRSYEKDPTNWMPEPLMQIPNSLCMAGRYEEALQWCDRIIGQYRSQRGIVRMFEKKKEEIRSRMPAMTGGGI